MGGKRVCLLLVTFLCLTESSPFPQANLKSFTLEEVVPPKDFYPERLSVQWISDTEFIHREPGVGILKYDAQSHSLSTILTETELYNLSDYMVSSFSDDGRYVLMTSDKKRIYRYSTIAEYFVYDLKDKSLKKVGKGPLQAVIWSKNNSLAYVYDNNVYYVPDAAKPDVDLQLTTQGVPGEVYFGVPDWIYEEEVFNAAEALWFSPNGTYLAIASFNDSHVESAVYPIYGNASDINNQYPELESFKYPKAGRENPDVGLRVIKVGDSKSEPWVIPAPVDVVGLDHILGRVTWASDQNLIVLWLNRRQSESVLVNCDLKQDKCSLLKRQMEPNGWIDIATPFFDKAGKSMVEVQPMYYQDQRFLHVSQFDFDSLMTKDLSPGNSTVTDILGWNEDTNTVYYIVAPSDTPWQRQLWASTDGVIRCVSCKEPSCHYTSGMFSLGASFGIVTCSLSNVPPRIFLYHSQNDSFALIKENLRLSERLSLYKLPMNLFNVISIGNDNVAHIKLMLPPNMEKGKQYPMVLRVYSGPGTSRVKDNYDLEFYQWYLSSNRSFIVAAIDVRGSIAMGVEAMHAVNRALGTVEVTDTLAAIKRLLNLYTFIDPGRVGVWGWSYGGFAATMMMVQDDERSLACAAAVAPVTSWLYYDSIYTERYMDTPTANEVGYERSDLTSLAEKLRGRRYLLVHGTGDDNVHFQHSMQLAKQLQHADIEFEQMSYTDESHSLLGVSRHFYHTLDHFWTGCFE